MESAKVGPSARPGNKANGPLPLLATTRSDRPSPLKSPERPATGDVPPEERRLEMGFLPAKPETNVRSLDPRLSAMTSRPGRLSTLPTNTETGLTPTGK